MRIKLLLLLLFALSLQTVSAVPTPQSNVNNLVGLEISYPKFDAVAINQDFNLSVHVYNISTGLQVTTATCNLEIYNLNGVNVLDSYFEHVGDEYVLFIDKGNFSSITEISYNIYCNVSTIGGFVDGVVYITDDGFIPQTSDAIFYVGVMMILLFVFFFIAYAGYVSEQLWIKVSSIGFGYLFLIAISFVGWSMASDFLISSPFLVEFLRIAFLVLTIGFFPFIIILFAYGVYLAMTISEMKKMIDSGMPETEAAERVRWKK